MPPEPDPNDQELLSSPDGDVQEEVMSIDEPEGSSVRAEAEADLNWSQSVWEFVDVLKEAWKEHGFFGQSGSMPYGGLRGAQAFAGAVQDDPAAQHDANLRMIRDVGPAALQIMQATNPDGVEESSRTLGKLNRYLNMKDARKQLLETRGEESVEELEEGPTALSSATAASDAIAAAGETGMDALPPDQGVATEQVADAGSYVFQEPADWSSAITGFKQVGGIQVTIRNKNALAIEEAGYDGEILDKGRFPKYENASESFTSGAEQLSANYQWYTIRTFEENTRKWAPKKDNNATEAYTRAIKRTVGQFGIETDSFNPNDPLQAAAMMIAMASIEAQEAFPFTAEDVINGMEAAEKAVGTLETKGRGGEMFSKEQIANLRSSLKITKLDDVDGHKVVRVTLNGRTVEINPTNWWLPYYSDEAA